MSRPVIACDADGVLIDLVGSMCRDAKILKGRTPEDFKVYNLFATLTAEEGKRVKDWASYEGTCSSLTWYLGARPFIEELKKLGEVFVATAPWLAPTWDSERRAALSNHIESSHVISVSAIAKPFATAAADVLIEDCAETIDKWLELTGSDQYAILIDRPWNRDYKVKGRCRRARDLQMALDLTADKVLK